MTTVGDHEPGEKKDPKTMLRDKKAVMIAKRSSCSRLVAFCLVMCRSFRSCVDEDPAVAVDVRAEGCGAGSPLARENECRREGDARFRAPAWGRFLGLGGHDLLLRVFGLRWARHGLGGRTRRGGQARGECPGADLCVGVHTTAQARCERLNLIDGTRLEDGGIGGERADAERAFRSSG